MFDELIEVALKSALENQEIKEKIKNLKINLRKQENNENKIINLEKNGFGIFEAKWPLKLIAIIWKKDY